MSYKPKKNQPYWMINSRWEVKQGVANGSNKSNGRIAVGNCFRTKEEAQAFQARMTGNRSPVKVSGMETVVQAIKTSLQEEKPMVITMSKKPSGIYKVRFGFVIFGHHWYWARRIDG